VNNELELNIKDDCSVAVRLYRETIVYHCHIHPHPHHSQHSTCFIQHGRRRLGRVPLAKLTCSSVI